MVKQVVEEVTNNRDMGSYLFLRRKVENLV